MPTIGPVPEPAVPVGGDVPLLGGYRCCLDFANTANWHAREQPVETLNGYVDVVGWGLRQGLISEHDSKPLLNHARRHPDAAAVAHRRAMDLRESIYRIFAAIAGPKPVPKDDLKRLDEAYARSIHSLRLTQSDERFVWTWAGPPDDLDRILWPVLHSAAQLLTVGPIDRVGQCADETGCGWLFLDTTKNRSRRWCDMRDCGNRAKIRRFNIRKRRAQ